MNSRFSPRSGFFSTALIRLGSRSGESGAKLSQKFVRKTPSIVFNSDTLGVSTRILGRSSLPMSSYPLIARLQKAILVESGAQLKSAASPIKLNGLGDIPLGKLVTATTTS